MAFDVVVVGAGAIGASAGPHLARYVEVLLDDARAAGAEVRYDSAVHSIVDQGNCARIGTASGNWEVGAALNCAGLYADRLAGPLAEDLRIIPFRGFYAELVAER